MQRFFFCGVGGSGMAPLALFLIRKGHEVFGSDRSYDQGRSPEKFELLKLAGVHLVPQDGSGVTDGFDVVVISSAIEPSIPDVAKALELGLPIVKRAEVLAALFNEAKIRIAVAGTSGKSTVTGMIATILKECGYDPSFINGGTIRNAGEAFHIGEDSIFITETDESDGSIALFNPTIAVLNNIELDHKSMDELKSMFRAFIERATDRIILNMDNENVRTLEHTAQERVITCGIGNMWADYRARDLELFADHSKFNINREVDVRLSVPGRHNVLNAAMAIAASVEAGVGLKDVGKGVEKFLGIKRRFEFVGRKNGIAVIDDFGHNPDKIGATLATLKQSDARVIAIFQPHGYGPLKLMGREIADVFGARLGPEDILIMPDVYYAGGTADMSVGSKNVIEWVQGKGVQAHHIARREDIPEFVAREARSGDRIIVMGARDDSLSAFVQDVFKSLRSS